MTNVASLAGTAALIGDPARASMLVTLMDGRALTAGELAGAAGVTPSTASGHLGRMLEAGLLALERQGRHRYYRIATPSVAGLIESLMSVTGELSAAASRCKPVRTGPRDRALRHARLCYDHLAGEVAVGIADCLVERGQLEFGQDGGVLTDDGADYLQSIGVQLHSSAPAGSRHATLCRPCLDWSERRPHLAGLVGRALYAALLQERWISEPADGRAVAITPIGQSSLNRHFPGALISTDDVRLSVSSAER
jgi:DNA-binding transcriptional ArsR family regulator